MVKCGLVGSEEREVCVVFAAYVLQYCPACHSPSCTDLGVIHEGLEALSMYVRSSPRVGTLTAATPPTSVPPSNIDKPVVCVCGDVLCASMLFAYTWCTGFQ